MSIELVASADDSASASWRSGWGLDMEGTLETVGLAMSCRLRKTMQSLVQDVLLLYSQRGHLHVTLSDW
jgi:hypothetical protein